MELWWWPAAEAAAMLEYKLAAAPGLLQYEEEEGKRVLPAPDEGVMPAVPWTTAEKFSLAAEEEWW